MSTSAADILSKPLYLEIDSTYRNRTQFPHASSFIVNSGTPATSGTTTAEKVTAQDPVCLGCPSTSWTSSAFVKGLSQIGLFGSVYSPSSASNSFVATSMTATDFIIEATGLQEMQDYYVGARYVNTVQGLASQASTVVKYSYLGLSASGNGAQLARVTISPGLVQAYGDMFGMYDPTDFSQPSISYIFVPRGPPYVNSFVGNRSSYSTYCYNETRNEFKLIKSYDNATRVISVSPSNDLGAPTTTWYLGDKFSIRQDVPLLVTVITSATIQTIETTTNSTDFDQTANFYVGDFIRIRADTYTGGPDSAITRRISGYIPAVIDSNTGKTVSRFTVTTPFDAIPTKDSIVEILRYSYDNVSPVRYSGPSISSLPAGQLWEIQLLNLTLPYGPLLASYGGTILDYPYVYVSINNVGTAFFFV